MKRNVIQKLASLEKVIGSVIPLVEHGRPTGIILAKIDSARNELKVVETILLKKHLGTVLERAGVEKRKKHQVLALCGF